MTTPNLAKIRAVFFSHSYVKPATSRIWTSVNSRNTTTQTGSALLLLLVPLVLLIQTAPVMAQDSCQVQETELRDAINSYARSCSQPRVDCDLFSKGWVCASFNMPSGQPEPGGVSATPTAAAVTTTDVPAEVASCMFSAPTLDAARSGYSNQCTVPRVDCDPMGGQWTCASYQLGSNSPGAGNPGASSGSDQTPSQATTPQTNTTQASTSNTGIVYGGDFGPPQRGWKDSYSANGRCYIASGFDHGIGSVMVNTPAGKRTVRQVAEALGGGPGIGNNPIYNDVQCGHGPANNAGDEDINQCPGRVDMGTSGCSQRGPTWDLSVFAPQAASAPPTTTTVPPTSTSQASPIGGPSNAKSALPGDSRYKPGDLIGMHYDNSGDRDDGHATVAAKMVVSYYGLDNALHIVNGAYHARFANGYNGDSEVVMNTTWGSEGRNSSWWNADARPDVVRNATAARWRQTLEAGRKVWLAEGGPSDFTAGVLRQLEATTNLNLKNIHIVQHSDWNEEHTLAENIRDVKRLTSYQRIGDGNRGDNNTPDLNRAHKVDEAVARRFESDPEFGDEWRAAFNYLPVFNCDRSGPHCKFDGSDAVALMWIVGVESDEIRDWSDFASRFAN